MATVAHDGYARAIFPVHTPFDGDVIFAAATGSFDGPVDLMMIGALATDVMATAILRAVRSATGIEGLPSVRDLKTPR